jgi:uncharacterized membrane protein SpoIIM required for sporulation
MREGQFINKNLKRWNAYQEETENPDEIAKRFTYLIDDLSYAKTFYPNSNTVRYINGMAAKIYLSIFKNKKENKDRLVVFWTTELPLVIRRNHKLLLFGFLFFLCFLAIGIFSAAQDQSFIRGVLGNAYVDTTERNIAEGNPFGIYKTENEPTMFLLIAFNNIQVTFLLYASGLFFGLGTVYFLFQNALMLGAFETMFFQHHLGFASILVVFIHGTLEISALVIASGAGLMLGNALLFPKTFTRVQSLKMAAKDSVKIIVALVPIFIVAAFFESFVTRHTEMPVWASLSILGASAFFIVFYFILYPIRVEKQQKNAHA